ncbi:DUF1127 domain-containing protein [Shinella sp. AETb1-6]|uniref:DUF1127 domain-containing protein n=1 Tax=Shinella sp. AETb1-6 TaxID=2692210 RepID=UPI00136898D3|nr:DUF1127 domain-containing protein [Shinella sp. AETb1-6]MXN53615.1 DUF1127 domain-containing protein [Shinella sp. AETb1-6]
MTIDAIRSQAIRAPVFPVCSLLRRTVRVYRIWVMKRRTRYALLDLTDAQLEDIGISRSEARREVAKSFYWN